MIILILFQFTSSAKCQTHEELFLQDGLVTSSYFDYFFDPDVDYSLHYARTDSLCEVAAHLYMHTQYFAGLYYYWEGNKMYSLSPSNCTSRLLFDFGLEVGETIPSGKYEGHKLLNKYPVELLNGEIRYKYDIGKTFIFTSWIEGIGDIVYGNAPNTHEFEGVGIFTCAKLNGKLLWINEEETERCEEFTSCIVPKALFDLEVDNLTVTTNNMSVYSESYEWDFGDGTIYNEKDVVHTFPSIGVYEVKLTASNSCSENSMQRTKMVEVLCIDFEIPDNHLDDDCDGYIDEETVSAIESALEDISVLPNPATDFISVMNMEKEQLNLSLFDIQGKLVLERNEQYDLDVSHLARGVYFLKIKFSSASKAIIKKVVLQ